MADLDCDYYGTSLHKWLSAPLGSGMLYVKKDKIDKIWPLLAEQDLGANDMHRLNHIGTHPVHTDLAILNAIEYQNTLGLDRKEARLRYLQHYWTSRLRDHPRVVVNSPAELSRHAGIGNVGIEGMEPADFAETLMKKCDQGPELIIWYGKLPVSGLLCLLFQYWRALVNYVLTLLHALFRIDCIGGGSWSLIRRSSIVSVRWTRSRIRWTTTSRRVR